MEKVAGKANVNLGYIVRTGFLDAGGDPEVAGRAIYRLVVQGANNALAGDH